MNHALPDRLALTFAACRAQNRAALITFITGGDPNIPLSAQILAQLPAAGADIIEIGMPFSDPMADGPVIQEANLRALKAGVNLRQVLKLVSDFRLQNHNTPIVLMGYCNPILAYGVDDFILEAKHAGVDALIIVDMPPEEADELAPTAHAAGLHLVRLVTPTTDDTRLPTLLKDASGFLYYVSVSGITGAARGSSADIVAALTRLQAASSLPIAVGFGIRTPQDASSVAQSADGVVVGSALVSLISQGIAEGANDIPERIRAAVQALARAIAQARTQEGA
jgi:tryptophan synthase alpha chain